MAGPADDRGGRRRAYRRAAGSAAMPGPRASANAVTASTALSGLTPTHSINGTRYINGGVRSGENADLAGYADVVVLSRFGGRTLTPSVRDADPPGQFEGLRKFPGRRPGKPGRGPAQAGQPRRGDHTGRRFPGPRWAQTRWTRRPASPPPVPVSPKASGKRPARRSPDDCTPPPGLTTAGDRGGRPTASQPSCQAILIPGRRTSRSGAFPRKRPATTSAGQQRRNCLRVIVSPEPVGSE